MNNKNLLPTCVSACLCLWCFRLRLQCSIAWYNNNSNITIAWLIHIERETLLYIGKKFVFNDSLYINVCFQSMVCCMQHNLLYVFFSVGLVIAFYYLFFCCESKWQRVAIETVFSSVFTSFLLLIFLLMSLMLLVLFVSAWGPLLCYSLVFFGKLFVNFSYRIMDNKCLMINSQERENV